MIGRGGMGAVFRAYDERLDRVVALKVLSPAFSRDVATVERFRNEAKAAARLDHENIARVYSSGEDRGVLFIAFEFVTGTNLRELIRQQGRLDVEEAVNYTLQVTTALRHTSAAGVVHRDIKPSNIIITPSGRAKLVDLGLARKESSESAPDLTVAGTTLGTFDYISPEQAKDPRNVDVRSDIYSLGCTLYHMLTGEAPYPEGTLMQRLLDRQDKSPPDPALKSSRVTPQLSAIVQRMMAARPRLRYPDADELLNDLMQVAGEIGLRGVHPEGLVWTHASRLNRSRFWERHLGWIVSAVLLLLIVYGVDRFSRTPVASDAPQQREGASGDVANQSEPTGSPSESGPGPTKGRDTDSPDGGLNGKGTEPSPKQDPDDPVAAVNQPSQITFRQMERDFRETMAAGMGVLGGAGIGDWLQLLESNGTKVSWMPTPADNDGSKTSGTAASKTGKTTAGVEKPQPITILTGEGPSEKSYPSLEAACTDALDGHVVILSYNGVRQDSKGRPVVDRPVTIRNKSITIRAADGYRPVVLFSGEEIPSRDPQTRMLTVANARIGIIGVGFHMRVNEQVDADNDARWTLFDLQGLDRIRLRGVEIQVENPKGRLASVFEVREKSGPDLAKMKMMKKGATAPADRFDVTILDSFIHGECELLAVHYPRPGLLELQNAALVTGQNPMLSVAADDSGEMVPESDRLELRMDHVTCLTRAPLVEYATGDAVGSVLPLAVNARNNLFSGPTDKPFVMMGGDGQISDFRGLLSWVGEKNFYERFPTMWLLAPDDSSIKPLSMDAVAWETHWGKSNDVDAHHGPVIWKRDFSAKSALGIDVPDLALDASLSSSRNPAATAATDGTAVGVNVGELAKRLNPPPAEETTPTE